MSGDQEDFDDAALIIGEDDDDAYLDVVMENLSNMISPKNAMTIDSTTSPPSMSSTSLNAKISPLLTNMQSVQIIEPETSVRGVDANNNPIFATSQTPYGFNVITKRKTSKKSVFNFENFVLPEEKSSEISAHDETPSGSMPMAMHTPSDSPASVHRRFLRAKPRGSGTEKILSGQAALAVEDQSSSERSSSKNNSSAPNGKVKGLYAFDSMDETALKSSIEYFNEKEYLDALKWNVLSPQSNQEPSIPTPKNPRKKADIRTDDPSSIYMLQLNAQQQQHSMYIQQQQMTMNNTIMAQNFNGSNTQQHSMMYPGPPHSLPYNGYYGNPTMMNTSEPLRAVWMNPSQPASNQQGSDLASQFQFYSGDINQLQLPSIQTAPAAVIPDNATFGFPYGYPGLHNAMTRIGYNNPDFVSLNDITRPNPANIQEIMNYQTLLQKKMDEWKLQTQNFDSSRPTNSRNANSSVPITMNTHDSDGEEGTKNGNVCGRASKSLSEISKRFVTMYGKDNTLDYIAGKVDPSHVSDVSICFHRVDAAAKQLGVHVRRIYELIKILEILSLVQFAGDKRGKFSWKGNKDFLRTLGEVQDDGLRAFPLMAAQSGLLQIQEQYSTNNAMKVDATESFSSPEKDSVTGLRGALFVMGGTSTNSFDLLNLSEEETERELLNSMTMKSSATSKSAGTNSTTNHVGGHHQQEEQFMVEIICKKFLQLFLVGMNYLSMSSAIQKLIPMEENQSLTDYNRVNATKIRRVYDVTNVLCSLNLIRKQTISRKSAFDAEVYNNIDSESSGIVTSVSVTAHPITSSISNGIDGNSSLTTKKAGKTGTHGTGHDRVDTKVLEWTSFNPSVIREQYLRMMNGK